MHLLVSARRPLSLLLSIAFQLQYKCRSSLPLVVRGFAVGSFSVKRVQADGRSESDAVLIRLQFTCLPSGWHPRERTKALPSACFHSLIPLRVCQSIGAVMKMLNYFYVWTSEINL